VHLARHGLLSALTVDKATLPGRSSEPPTGLQAASIRAPALPNASIVQLSLSRSPTVQLPSGKVLGLALRDAALLAWLAIEGPTTRARLASLLWSESDGESARNALRQRLFQMRRHTGVELVAGQALMSLADGVTHDLEEADAVLSDAVGEAVANGEFAQWLAAQRRKRGLRRQQSLSESLAGAERAGDWAQALAWARELLAFDPLSEPAHRGLMRAHYLAGDRAAAMLAFDRCEQMLKDEVGARPSAETLALLATIESAAPLASPADAAGPLPASVLRPPRMIGRDRELTALLQGLRAGQVVALDGEAGLGKTRLLQTLLAAQPGVIYATGRPGDAGVPFATLARLLRAVFGHAGAAATQEWLGAAGLRGEIARVLPEFDPGGHRPSGEGQRLALQRALRDLLACQPGIDGLVVDDLHFADDASLEMIGALIDDGDGCPAGGRRLAWVLASRPAEGGSAARVLLDSLAEQARLWPLALAPLDEAALAELVVSLGLPGVDGAALAPALRQRTGGNPLFVLETLKQAWVDRALARLADPRQLPRPLSVGRLIERRVSQLSPGALALARVASVAGVDFGIGLAEQVLGLGAMQFADALNELETAQVMRGMQFAHDLVHDAVHASVPAAIARHTHAQVAAWLESHQGEPARIAAHWEAAGQGPRALPWLEAAALAARRALRSKEFIGFLERKSHIESTGGDAQAAFATLMRAVEEYTNVDSATDTVLAYCDRLDQLAVTPAQQLEARLQRAVVLKQHGAVDTAVRQNEASLAKAVRLGEETLLMRAHMELGSSLILAERMAQALPHLQACTAWITANGDDELRSELHGNLGVAYDNAGRLDEGLPHHHLAFEYAHLSGNLSNAAVSCGNEACNRVDAGDLVAAEALLQRGQQIMQRYDAYGSNSGLLYLVRALCLCHLGRYGQALDQADKGRVAMREYQEGYLPYASLRQATCWWHLGQWARLRQTLDELNLDDSATLGLRVLHARLRWAGAAAAGTAEARSTAHRAMVEALEAFAPGQRPDLRLPLLVDLAATQDAAAACAALLSVRREAEAIGHLGTALAADIRLAAAALHSDAARAAQAAHDALALAAQRQTTVLLPAELWLHAGRALAATGDAGGAARVVAQGCDWLHDVAQAHVPTHFRDAFLRRQPLHVELLALANGLA